MCKNGITQSKLAEMLYITESTLRTYLTGKIEIRKSFIDKILKVTGITYEQAFLREE